jgi:hypothetical protein
MLTTKVLSEQRLRNPNRSQNLHKIELEAVVWLESARSAFQNAACVT